MFIFNTNLRIHYALTDQMGVVYHGNYAQFYEIGRTEALRSLGITYKDMEAMGVIMPVIEMYTRFVRPALYDDLIRIKITVKDLPLHHKIVFQGEIFNEKNKLLNAGTVTLYFLEAKTMKRSQMPEAILKKMKEFFS